MKYKLLIVNPAAQYGEKGTQSFFSTVEGARKAANDMVGTMGKGCRADIYLVSLTLVESLNLDAPITVK